MSQIINSEYGNAVNILRESSDRKCTGFYCYPDHKGWNFCALGTIAHKADENPIRIMFGIHNRDRVWGKMGVDRKTLRKTMKKCPQCDGRINGIGLIAHLNDNHKLTWGEIANNLERAENYDESQPKINKILDTMKCLFYSDSKITNSILQKVENRFRQ